jgi:hypothetical protein
MSWVWRLYRERSPDDWISGVRQDRFVIPDDLIPVLEKSHPEDELSPSWPPRWTTFNADFAQSLCFLRGGHGEFVRFYQLDGQAKCDMTREAGLSLQPRLMRIVAGVDALQPPERRAAVIAELNSLADEYPWSSSVLLERGVQKDELGHHKDAIVDFRPSCWNRPIGPTGGRSPLHARGRDNQRTPSSQSSWPGRSGEWISRSAAGPENMATNGGRMTTAISIRQLLAGSIYFEELTKKAAGALKSIDELMQDGVVDSLRARHSGIYAFLAFHPGISTGFTDYVASGAAASDSTDAVLVLFLASEEYRRPTVLGADGMKRAVELDQKT